jgi:hypothetical protein
MLTRAELLAEGKRLLEGRDRSKLDPIELLEEVAGTLGLPETGPGVSGSWLFARRADWTPPEVAERFDGVIMPVRYDGRAIHRDAGWWQAVRLRGVQLVGMDWGPLPGAWRPGLARTVRFLSAVGARALCINAEPLPPGRPVRWEGKPDEARAFATMARDLCDKAGLELWFSSWARPVARRSFPWAEFVAPAQVCIPQPYRVHGRPGPDYELEVIEAWRELGAREILLGRGAHELDRSDSDAWRTPAQIRAHRDTTPPGYGEAWWVPAGDLLRRSAEVDAMVSDLASPVS